MEPKGEYFVKLLGELAPRLPEPLLSEALQTSRHIILVFYLVENRTRGLAHRQYFPSFHQSGFFRLHSPSLQSTISLPCRGLEVTGPYSFLSDLSRLGLIGTLFFSEFSLALINSSISSFVFLISLMRLSNFCQL